MAKLLTGKQVVASLGEGLAPRVAALAARGITPTLAVVRMGERPDDLSYERTAAKRAASLGIGVRSLALAADASFDELACAIEAVNADASVHGCLVFRPLPPHVDEARACNLLLPEKDVDGITSSSLAGVFAGAPQGFPPATAQACLEVLDHYGVSVEGKHVVVVGRSLVIGRPVAMMLLGRNASVTLCHSKTEDLESLTRLADVMVCATGRPRAFGAAYFRSGQTVLDVGINFDAQGALCGDVDFDAVEPVLGDAGSITPVPGGLGSVTTSVTMAHVVQAAEKIAEG
ncbi:MULTISPECIES: bifunctional 5,10-methylenetetrahydrofolate dehydrogenase/5,10-methenyltetrahydrofolate cyclohydrolase [unclassified Adlercreutzia]|uniref:bifunctional 5,10-methylenetetrahydrofolate dehydrogenase/5,10-methenyltetrahydrofolate cyclohydrolase n=1 Tax=unclassified Adlercreutzia TaxID=2636013 RepID=UPI0013EADF57|nr:MULTISPECIES: tetrahydrofolate dehydrogenase/cyclohydrolase catalytic domain-containing protein [unclassified Adlercreutzia]